MCSAIPVTASRGPCGPCAPRPTTPEKCCAGYYPECNALVPWWHYAKDSKTPAAKLVRVHVRKAEPVTSERTKRRTVPRPRASFEKRQPGQVGLFFQAMSADFTKKLARPLSTTDGGVLRTALDVQEYLLHLPEARAQLPRWENVRQALGAATDVREFSWHVEVALMLDRKLR
jgi:hypothetical protein